MFLDDGEDIVSEIPSTWLCDDDGSCWWPNNNKKVAKLMVIGSTPDETWIKYKIKLLGFASTLNRARFMAERDLATSADEEELGRGKRKTVRKPSTDSEGTSESDYEHLPKLKQNPLAVNTVNISAPSKDTNEVSDGLQFLDELRISAAPSKDTDEASGGIQIVHVEYVNNNTDVNNEEIREAESQLIENVPKQTESAGKVTLDEIMKAVSANNLLLISIESRLARLEGPNLIKTITLTTPNETDICFNNLPIKNLEELKKLEALLEDRDNVKAMMSLLSIIGGKNVKDATHRYLSKFYASELTVHCSWLGHRNNFKMRDLKSIKLIQETLLKQFKNIKCTDFEQLTSEWIRLSKQRLQREKKSETVTL